VNAIAWGRADASAPGLRANEDRRDRQPGRSRAISEKSPAWYLRVEWMGESGIGDRAWREWSGWMHGVGVDIPAGTVKPV
jgi:hypothetical protein